MGMLKKVWNVCAATLFFLSLWSISVFAEPKAFDYLLPEADTKIYSEEELGVMSLQVTCYAKNEIYARHGRKFNSSELTEYFNQQPWYQGTIAPGDFTADLLNSNEQANVQALAQREKELSWDGNGYELDTPYYSFTDIYEYLSRDGYNILEGLEVYATSGTAIMDAAHFYLMLPTQPKWSYIQLDQNCFEIYYAPAREAGYGGHIVTIAAYDLADDSYIELPSWKVCGLSADKRFVAIFPTDVQFDPSDASQASEYRTLLDWARTLDFEAANAGNPFMSVDTQ